MAGLKTLFCRQSFGFQGFSIRSLSSLVRIGSVSKTMIWNNVNLINKNYEPAVMLCSCAAKYCSQESVASGPGDSDCWCNEEDERWLWTSSKRGGLHPWTLHGRSELISPEIPSVNPHYLYIFDSTLLHININMPCFLSGARWDTQSGVITEAVLRDLIPSMPVLYVRAVPAEEQEIKNTYMCPVYRTKQRGPTYVWAFHLRTKQSPAKWVVAGVALLLSVWDCKEAALCLLVPILFYI